MCSSMFSKRYYARICLWASFPSSVLYLTQIKTDRQGTGKGRRGQSVVLTSWRTKERSTKSSGSLLGVVLQELILIKDIP